MKSPLLSALIFLISFNTSAGQTAVSDSVKYKNQWLKVYPYDHVIDKYYRSDMPSTSEIFIPLQLFPDGYYVQFYKNASTQVNTKLLPKKRKIATKKEPKQKEFIHAIFIIKDGKLNGVAHFLDLDKKIICSGIYKDNLKTGTWFYDKDKTNYENYSNGVLHGKSERHSISAPWWSSYTYVKIRKSRYYEEGIYMGGSASYGTKKNNYFDTITVLFSDSLKNETLLTTTYHNTILFKKKHNTYVERIDTIWNYDYNLKSIYIGNPSLTLRLTDNFNVWIKYYPIQPDENLIIDNLFDQYTKKNSFFNLAEARSKDGPTNFYASGTVIEYYPNGNVKFSLTNLPGRDAITKIDTLFYENGEPRYFVKAVDSTELVAEYFDTTGKKISETRVDIRPKTPEILTTDEKNFIMHKGFKLSQTYWKGDRYEFKRTLPSPELRELFDSTEYYFYLLKSLSGLTSEKFYDFKQRTRTEIFKLDTKKTQYTKTLKHVFDSTYRLCESNFTFNLHERFEVSSNFSSITNFRNEIDSTLNWYECEQRLDIPPFDRNTRGNKISQEELSQLISKCSFDVQPTVYTLDSKPFSGKLKINFNKKSTSLKLKEDELLIDVNFGFAANSEITLRDNLIGNRSHLSCVLFPDLFYHFPHTGKGWNIHSHNGKQKRSWNRLNVFKPSYIKAEIKDGKLHGIVELHYGNSKLINRIKFCDGKPCGEILIYTDGKNKEPLVIGKFIFIDGQLSEGYQFSETLLNDTVYYAQFENGLLKKTQYKNISFDEFSREYRINSIRTFTYINGELNKQIYQRPLATETEIHELNYKNGQLNGPANKEMCNGTFNNNVFTGTITHDYGTKKNVNHLVNDNLVKSELFINSVLISEIDYDTNLIKLDCNLNWLFNEAYIPAPANYFINPSHTTFFQTKSKYYYENGIVAASGTKHSVTSFRNRIEKIQGYGGYGGVRETYQRLKTGTWHYFNPDGELKREVIYPTVEADTAKNTFIKVHRRLEFTFTGDDSLRISYYTKGVKEYEALMLSYFTLYDCNQDVDHEIFDLKIEFDVASDGTKIYYPSRYHRNFYDVGVLQSEGNIVDGLPDGLWKYYNFEGKLMMLGQFKNGKREGRWIKGDLEGMAFLGEFCINPDLKLDEKAMESMNREVNLEIIVYSKGELISTSKISAYRN